MQEQQQEPQLISARRQVLGIVGISVLLLAAVAVPQVLSRPSSKPVDLSNIAGPLRPTDAFEYRGVGLQLPSNDPDNPYEKYVEEIARTGANTILLSVAALQENGSSSFVSIDLRKVPSNERLEKIIKLARDLKLKVGLMPIVLLENPASGEWRGLIKPREPNKWWEAYENYILHYAKLAQKTGVEILSIGSELISLEEETEHWQQLIAKVRKAYKGKLTYSANWDHYEKEIKYWGDLDLVGMTTYHDLCGDKKPTLDVLIDTWKPIKKKILEWQQTVNRPILFTEVGWPNLETAAKEPWNYCRTDVQPDPELQARCFEAFFMTWKDEPKVAGLFVWEWRNYPGHEGGPKDPSYYPGGKPAMDVILKFFKASAAADKTADRNGKQAGKGPAPATTTAPSAPLEKPQAPSGQANTEFDPNTQGG